MCLLGRKAICVQCLSSEALVHVPFEQMKKKALLVTLSEKAASTLINEKCASRHTTHALLLELHTLAESPVNKRQLTQSAGKKIKSKAYPPPEKTT